MSYSIRPCGLAIFTMSSVKTTRASARGHRRVFTEDCVFYESRASTVPRRDRSHRGRDQGYSP